MNRNDIFRTSANGIDPYGSTSHGTTWSRDRWHSHHTEEDRYLEPRDGYVHDPRDHRDAAHGFWSREWDRPGFRGRDENRDFWGNPRDREAEREYRSFHDRMHPSMWERVKGAFTGKGPKNWTRSDERIREDVCEVLAYHPDVDASEIEVLVKDGEVTLTGTVADRREKRVADDLADNVRGVKDVHNQLRIKPRG